MGSKRGTGEAGKKMKHEIRKKIVNINIKLRSQAWTVLGFQHALPPMMSTNALSGRSMMGSIQDATDAHDGDKQRRPNRTQAMDRMVDQNR